MKIINNFGEFREFVNKHKGKTDDLKIREVTFEEFQKNRGIGMNDVREFCEGVRKTHETQLVSDPLREIKAKKVAIIHCLGYDKDIEEEVKMYEMETGIDIILFVDSK